jgi:hypothetical protein
LTATGSHPPSCTTLSPDALKLIPNPIPGKPFPVPDEGSDESEGVVVFEADVQPSDRDYMWVAVHIEAANGAGWIIGGFAPSQDNGGVVVSKTGATGLSSARPSYILAVRSCVVAQDLSSAKCRSNSHRPMGRFLCGLRSRSPICCRTLWSFTVSQQSLISLRLLNLKALVQVFHSPLSSTGERF